MEAIEKAIKTLSGDKSLDQDDNEGPKVDGFTVEKSLENGFRDSLNGKEGLCIDEIGEGLEDSEINGASSLLEMKESVGNIDVNGERNESGQEGIVSLLGAVDKSNGIGVENVLPDDDNDVNGDDDGIANFDEDDDGDKMILDEIDDNADDEGDDDGGGEFSAGYFVWGKIKSHPWWPGQVYNPTDASDYASKVRQKGRLLVAYFGDSSFAWCHPSQLKAFEDNFEDMSKVSSSKNFVNAVRTSVDEVSRLVEADLTCLCVPKENCIGLERPLAANAGIKKGVLVPEGGIRKVSIGLSEPQEVLGKLKQVSQAGSASNLLECAVLKGWLSAFNRSIGRPRMATYHEPLSIPDIEENLKTLVVDMSDYCEAVENPITKPVEEGWISSSSRPKFGQGSRTLLRCPDTSEDGMDHTRKQKSIADILKGESDVRPQAPKVTKSGKRASSARSKKTKSNDKADGDDGSRVETDVIGAKEEIDKEKTKSKRASLSNGDDQGKEDTDNQPVSAKRKVDVVPGIGRVDSFSRERKKSKYLSPPYTTSIGKVRKPDIEDESVEVPKDTRFEENMTKATVNLVIGERNELPEEVHAEQASDESTSLTPKSYFNRVIDPVKVETPANEVLVELRSIALSPQYTRNNSSFELVGELLSAFRSSVYQDGSDHDNQPRHRKKRKSPEVLTVSSGKDQSMASHVPSGHKPHEKNVVKNKETKKDRSGPGKDIWASLKNTKKPKPYKPKMKETTLAAVMKKNDKGVDGNPAALFVTFGPGSTLPEKDDLIRIYSRYGALDMDDTDIFYNNFCARVVFLKTSDAEQAFTSSQNDSPFGSANVSFRLRVHQAELEALNHKELASDKMASPLAKEGTEISTPTLAPGNPRQLNYIKQKLETLTSMLETSDENISVTKSKLQSEIKGILEIVNTMVESSS